MIAFISFTPHHTWNAIVMAKKLFPEEECHLYLSDSCSGYLDVVERVKREGVFTDVIPCQTLKLFCNECKNKYLRKIKRALYFLNWRGFLKKYAPIKRVKYDKVFFAGLDDPRCFILSGMKRFSPDMEACFYEDGANDYLYASHIKHKGIKARFARLVGLKY